MRSEVEKEKRTDISTADFFNKSDAEQKEILDCALTNADYSSLIKMFGQALLNSSKAVENNLSLLSIESQYFDLFLQKANQLNVDEELVYKFIFSVFTSDENSPIQAYRQAIEQYLVKQAFVDLPKLMNYAVKFDPTYKSFSFFMQADRDKTLEFLLDLLFNGAFIRKSNIRKFLLNININVFDTMKSIYSTAKVNKKEGIIRFLLLYKNDIRVSDFLLDVEKTEKSKVIQKLLKKDKKLVNTKRSVSLDGDGRGNRIECFFQLMKSGEELPLAVFNEKVLGDAINSEIASSLFFSVYTNNIFTDIVVVEDGKINDLDNNRKILEDNQVIRVLHPVEITTKYMFLKRIRIRQIFDQVTRKVYLVGEEEKSSNAFSNLSGSIVSLSLLKANMKKFGFKTLNRANKIANQIGREDGDVLCVMDISPTDFSQEGQSVTFFSAKFYQTKDVVRINGDFFVDNVPKMLITSIGARRYSEFIHSLYDLMERQ